jgi:hypothetical protein
MGANAGHHARRAGVFLKSEPSDSRLVREALGRLFGSTGVRPVKRLDARLGLYLPEPGTAPYFLCAARLHAVSAPVGSIAVFPCSM